MLINFAIFLSICTYFIIANMDKDKSISDLKKKLTDIQYHVTQEKGTERPFTGEYTSTFDKGVYNCVVCGEPLFLSEDKFESGCGWPAFSREINEGIVKYDQDTSHGMTRVEITCNKCGAHLGHVFNDGPAPTGMRHCVNSASLKFIKK